MEPPELFQCLTEKYETSQGDSYAILRIPKNGSCRAKSGPNSQDMGKLRTESRDPLPTGLLKSFENFAREIPEKNYERKKHMKTSIKMTTAIALVALASFAF